MTTAKCVDTSLCMVEKKMITVINMISRIAKPRKSPLLLAWQSTVSNRLGRL